MLSFVLPGMAYLAETKDVALTGGDGEGSGVRAYRIEYGVLIVFGLAMIVLVPAAVMRSALYKCFQIKQKDEHSAQKSH